MARQSVTRLDTVMGLLGVPAVELGPLCGVSNSLVSRWQKGLRPLPARGKSLLALTDALARLDTGGALDDLLSPYREGAKSKAAALRVYLTTEEIPALPERAKPQPVQNSGSYFVRQQVLLGAKGFRQGALLMLDYVTRLPPGRVVYVCAHSGFDLWFKNLPFALQFLQKLNRAVQRGAAFVLITNPGAFQGGHNFFSAYWLVAHLKGMIRSRYYTGTLPPEYFVGVIPGYWCGHTEADATAEDGLLTTVCTDPRHVRRDEAHCDAHLQKSAPASQYGFLRSPGGDSHNGQTWRPGPLPPPERDAPGGFL